MPTRKPGWAAVWSVSSLRAMPKSARKWPVAPEQDVGGDVAVHDAVGVDVGQRPRERDADAFRLLSWERPRGDAGQTFLDQGHYQIPASAVLPCVIERGQVGVLQAGKQPHLAVEQHGAPRVHLAALQHLDRDLAAQRAVEAPIHLPATAPPQQCAHLIAVTGEHHRRGHRPGCRSRADARYHFDDILTPDRLRLYAARNPIAAPGRARQRTLAVQTAAIGHTLDLPSTTAAGSGGASTQSGSACNPASSNSRATGSDAAAT